MRLVSLIEADGTYSPNQLLVSGTSYYTQIRGEVEAMSPVTALLEHPAIYRLWELQYSDNRLELDKYFARDEYRGVDFIKIDTDGHDYTKVFQSCGLDILC